MKDRPVTHRSAERVFLTRDRKKAVADGSPDAAYLLVGKGGEIREDVAKKYEGALELIAPAKKQAASKTDAPEPQNRESEIADKTHKRGK